MKSETLALRMDRICENAVKVATHLRNHLKMAWVNHAGLPPGHRPQRQLKGVMKRCRSSRDCSRITRCG